MGSILEEIIEITQHLKSSPDRIDNMSASVHPGSTRSVSVINKRPAFRAVEKLFKFQKNSRNKKTSTEKKKDNPAGSHGGKSRKPLTVCRPQKDSKLSSSGGQIFRDFLRKPFFEEKQQNKMSLLI